MKITSLLILALVSQNLLVAQCESWVGSPKETEASDAHVIYRTSFKEEKYADAFDNWKKAYDIAPAADGKRASHYLDGIEIYKSFLKTSTDDAQKKEYKDAIMRLYDEAIACYESRSITVKCPDGNVDKCYKQKVGQMEGRKGYDMYYTINAPYSGNLEILEKSIEKTDVDAEYSVIMPIAAIAVYQFKNKLIDAEKARSIHAKINEIGEKNKDAKLGNYYEDALKNANASYKEIERDIFDCAYFQTKWEPSYRDDPSPQAAKDLYNQLKLQGCTEADPLMAELKKAYEAWANSVNAERQAEFEANNPGVLASKLYKQGKYQEAIDKYKVAISDETDPSKKAGYHSSIASILFRKLKKYGDARAQARKAISLRPGWGKPIMMIGDMYATGARGCGDAWNQRLAVIAAIDKYNAAKVDPEFAQEAASKAAKYRSSLPELAEGHMRGVKAGQSQTVGCWIGEKVKVRYK